MPKPLAFLSKLWLGPPAGDTAVPPAPTPPSPALRAFPAVATRHVASDARLYANRHDLILALGVPRAADVAELGVGLGFFSEFILDSLRPRRFVAIDTFQLHTIPVLWDHPSAELFGGKSHREYYEHRLARYADVLDVREGDSHDCLSAFPDQHFYLIYVDAHHTYEGVKRDIAQAVRKMRLDGVLVFNDYVLADHARYPYGVVPAVNELLAAGEWQIVGLALENRMYCVALRRWAR